MLSVKYRWPRCSRLGRALAMLALLPLMYILIVGQQEQQGWMGRRLMAEEMNGSVSSNATDDPLFPKDLFTPYQLSHGAVTLHIIGVIYMFYALALVCDEYFVPSLDVISEKLNISPDVAGATFMAAGGSAPELFTSIIGVFIAKTDVGIGTIVGSAVFNILFVIAACAFAAKEALSLSAWPLIRDVFFYSISLVLLVAFFYDEKIELYEAIILFIWYGVYVGFMKFNEQVEDGLRKCFRLPAVERDDKCRGITLRQAENRRGLYHLMNETINPGILKKPHQPKKQQSVDGEEMKPLRQTGIMIGDGVPAAPGSANSGGGISQLKNHLQTEVSPEAEGDTKGEVNVDKEANELEIDAGDDMEGGEDPIDMSFPKGEGWKRILIYIVSFPIMAPLYLTLPDTKNPKRRKLFPITFIGSILWIAVYSYLMVWWASVAGDVFGIPPDIMGLTFLAAGTSVPDLITSVLVAKQGKGDMAVSSSVGSNIFDVTVGLPVPWILYTAINNTYVEVSAEGVGCSVTMLFSMLIAVFLCILVFKWKMTKGMGVLMLVLYFIFLIVNIGFSLNWYPCLIGRI